MGVMDIEHLQGVEGIKLLFEKALQNNQKIIRTVLSDIPLVYLAGEEFAEQYMARRASSNIHLKSLRFSTKKVDLGHHRDYDRYNKQVRVSVQSWKPSHSLVLWDDSVAIIDPQKLSVVMIKNAMSAEMMREWFDLMWENSPQESPKAL